MILTISIEVTQDDGTPIAGGSETVEIKSQVDVINNMPWGMITNEMINAIKARLQTPEP